MKFLLPASTFERRLFASFTAGAAALLMLAGLIAVVAMIRSQATSSQQNTQATHSEQTASGTSGAVVTSLASGTRTDNANHVDNAEVRQLRVLRFDDAPDGSVAVIDVGSGELVQRFEGEQGFLQIGRAHV